MAGGGEAAGTCFAGDFAYRHGHGAAGVFGAELAALRDDPSLLEGLRIDYVMTHLVSADVPADPMNAHQARGFWRR